MNPHIPKNLVSMVTFLYLMICLWLWIVPTMSNNNSNTLLDSLLFTAENKWNIDKEHIIENMNKIAFHESKYGTEQYTPIQKGGGPGRGLFQFEKGEDQGAETAITRLINQLGYKPNFLEGIEEKDYDISGLLPEQQQILFLGNLLQKPEKGAGFYDINKDDLYSNKELANLWATHHQAGTKPGTKEYDDIVNKFLEDIAYYNK
jgi:hypothetical protein